MEIRYAHDPHAMYVLECTGPLLDPRDHSAETVPQPSLSLGRSHASWRGNAGSLCISYTSGSALVAVLRPIGAISTTKQLLACFTEPVFAGVFLALGSLRPIFVRTSKSGLMWAATHRKLPDRRSAANSIHGIEHSHLTPARCKTALVVQTTSSLAASWLILVLRAGVSTFKRPGDCAKSKDIFWAYNAMLITLLVVLVFVLSPNSSMP